MPLDTLSIARELREADVAPAQAEAIASAIGKAVTEGAATKADFQLLGQRLESFEARMVSKFETMSAEVKAGEERLGRKVEAARAWLLSWFVSIFVAAIGLFVAIWKVL